MKNFFEMKDNVIDKLIESEIQKFEFVRRRNIKAMTKDLYEVYAKYFCDGNIEKAKKKLNGDRFIVSNKDLFLVSFLGGGSFIIIVMTFLYCFM